MTLVIKYYQILSMNFSSFCATEAFCLNQYNVFLHKSLIYEA
jgi:hypothetical protein